MADNEAPKTPREQRVAQDARIDRFTEGAIDAGVAVATVVAAAAFPPFAIPIAAGGALAAHAARAMARRATKEANTFFEVVESDAAVLGFDTQQIMDADTMEESAADAFYTAYRNVMQATDARATPALGHLVSEVLFEGYPRDAFFRDAGRVFAEADGIEWDSLEALLSVLRVAADTPPADYESLIGVRIVDHPEASGRVLLRGLDSAGGHSRSYWDAATNAPVRAALLLLVRHGFAILGGSDNMNVYGATPQGGFELELDRALRLEALIRRRTA